MMMLKTVVGFAKPGDQYYGRKFEFEKNWMMNNQQKVKGKTNDEIQLLIFKDWNFYLALLIEQKASEEKPEGVYKGFNDK